MREKHEFELWELHFAVEFCNMNLPNWADTREVLEELARRGNPPMEEWWKKEHDEQDRSLIEVLAVFQVRPEDRKEE